MYRDLRYRYRDQQRRRDIRNATDELLGYLDQLDSAFQDFAALDFPTEFDYLESLADEASEYMTTAVESYHDAYDNGGYNQLTADYAKENYAELTSGSRSSSLSCTVNARRCKSDHCRGNSGCFCCRIVTIF